jgi:hypothetical protein
MYQALKRLLGKKVGYEVLGLRGQFLKIGWLETKVNSGFRSNHAFVKQALGHVALKL